MLRVLSLSYSISSSKEGIVKKKKVMFLFCLVVFIGLYTTAVHAESYDCIVISAGPMGMSKVVIQLSYDGQGGTFNKSCKAWVGREKEMLAVALTAMANSMMVSADTHEISVEEPVIKALYLLNQPVP